MSAPSQVSWTTFRTLGRIFVAFGQGAGQLTVSDDALEAAFDDYAPRIERSEDWSAAWPTVLGVARLMGQAAAEHALREGQVLITAENYAAARTLIHRTSAESGESRMLIGRCPWP